MCIYIYISLNILIHSDMFLNIYINIYIYIVLHFGCSHIYIGICLNSIYAQNLESIFQYTKNNVHPQEFTTLLASAPWRSSFWAQNRRGAQRRGTRC